MRFLLQNLPAIFLSIIAAFAIWVISTIHDANKDRRGFGKKTLDNNNYMYRHADGTVTYQPITK